MTAMTEVVGRVVNGVYVHDEENLLVFDTSGGQVAYATYGDCCSETWFADIVGVKSLLGQAVRAAENIDVPDHLQDDERSRQDYDQYMGVRLYTDVGSCDIIYRNSSNGYYGGDIEYVRDYSADVADFKHHVVQDWRA